MQLIVFDLFFSLWLILIACVESTWKLRQMHVKIEQIFIELFV